MSILHSLMLILNDVGKRKYKISEITLKRLLCFFVAGFTFEQNITSYILSYYINSNPFAVSKALIFVNKPLLWHKS